MEALNYNGIFYWNIKFKLIYLYTSENEKIKLINNIDWNEANLKAEYSYIVGTGIYYNTIYTSFFNKYEYSDTK